MNQTQSAAHQVNSPANIIGITLGEPAGIGPDILIMLAAVHQFKQPIIAISSIELLRQRVQLLGIQLNCLEIFEADLPKLKPQAPGTLYVFNIPLPEPGIDCVTLGAPSIKTAAWVLNTIQTATLMCAKHQIAAMVTGPVQKSIINAAKISFSGHTEYIAQTLSLFYNTRIEPLMMLTSGNMLKQPLRVALATTHHPVADLPKLITQAKVFEKLQALHSSLQTFYGIEQPKILVAGFNPHAGEEGHLGMEDIEEIKPAIAQAQAQGIHAQGPLPADTLFTPHRLRDVDAVLAMYHDQGLPVLKYASFGGAINVTLGIPIIRTSVDHGTALDLAGSLKADPSSLKAAVEEAQVIIDAASSSH